MSGPVLTVGDYVKVTYKGVTSQAIDCGTWRVIGIDVGVSKYDAICVDRGVSGLVPGVQYGLPWAENSDWDWVLSTEKTTLPTIEVAKPQGSTCRRPGCPEPFNIYAEPTRLSDRSHVCFSCRSDNWGVTWGDK